MYENSWGFVFRIRNAMNCRDVTALFLSSVYELSTSGCTYSTTLILNSFWSWSCETVCYFLLIGKSREVLYIDDDLVNVFKPTKNACIQNSTERTWRVSEFLLSESLLLNIVFSWNYIEFLMFQLLIVLLMRWCLFSFFIVLPSSSPSSSLPLISSWTSTAKHLSNEDDKIFLYQMQHSYTAPIKEQIFSKKI